MRPKKIPRQYPKLAQRKLLGWFDVVSLGLLLLVGVSHLVGVVVLQGTGVLKSFQSFQ